MAGCKRPRSVRVWESRCWFRGDGIGVWEGRGGRSVLGGNSHPVWVDAIQHGPLSAWASRTGRGVGQVLRNFHFVFHCVRIFTCIRIVLLSFSHPSATTTTQSDFHSCFYSLQPRSHGRQKSRAHKMTPLPVSVISVSGPGHVRTSSNAANVPRT